MHVGLRMDPLYYPFIEFRCRQCTSYFKRNQCILQINVDQNIPQVHHFDVTIMYEVTTPNQLYLNKINAQLWHQRCMCVCGHYTKIHFGILSTRSSIELHICRVTKPDQGSSYFVTQLDQSCQFTLDRSGLCVFLRQLEQRAISCKFKHH